jgi:hypothetical protein
MYNYGRLSGFEWGLYREGVGLTHLLQDKSPPVGDIFKFLVYEVVFQHMLYADRDFFPFISSTVGTLHQKFEDQK